MMFLRKSLVWLAVSALPLLLFGLAANLALARSAGSPEPIKKILKESRIYDSAIDAVLEATDNPNVDGQGGGIRGDNPVVVAAAKKAFTPQLVQNSSENFIDGLYGWLEGKTQTPQFRIDLTAAKASFVNEVAAGAEARAAGLPACPRGQTSFEDPFSAACLPRGLSPAAAGDKIRQELSGGEENFLKDPVITADDLKSKDGRPAFSSTSALPENYQRIKKVPVILAVLAGISLLAVIFLSESRQKGLRRAGVTLLVVGIVLLVFAWAANSLVNKAAIPKIKIENSALQDRVRGLVKDVSGTVSKNFMLSGGAYTALGIAGIGGAWYIGKNSRPKAGQAAPNPKAKG